MNSLAIGFGERLDHVSDGRLKELSAVAGVPGIHTNQTATTREPQMAKLLSGTLTDRTDLRLAAGLFALCLMALALSSCNTVEGMGEDVSAAGGAVSDTADDVEDEM